MKNLIVLVTIAVLISLKGIAQITEKGKPTINDKIQEKIPLIILPDVNEKKLKREDRHSTEIRQKKIRFAQVIQVDIDVKQEGIVEKDEEGNKTWYLSIKSPGAYSLGVLFDYYRLPIGSKLFVYNSDKEHIRGAFTYKNNKYNYMLPVSQVKGDEIILEYYEPYNVEFPGNLHISGIAHDYRNLFGYLAKQSKGFDDSGDCNININCSDDELWQLLKHSVCKITYNGWLCTGALVNNTNNDGYPYLLTANHCINNAFDASAAIFYFNYESPGCVNQDGDLDQTISGSSIVATPPLKTLDFSLLELSIEPPASYKPYYAGWNRDVKDPQSVTSIHHPRGDIKKITKSYEGASTNDYGEGYNEYSHWWIDEWDEGTTEGGSSGSPLFDENGEIIGDLSGGDANCSFNYNDYYQQIYHSWQDFTDPAFQLKPWLDPLNSEEVSINGYLPYDSIPSYLRATYTDTVIHLSWNEVVDTSGISFYYVYRNNMKIDSVKVTSYADTLAYKSVLYKYKITAKYKNPEVYESLPSNTVYVRTMDALFLPFNETFEDGILPDFWFEERSNDTVGWVFKAGGFDGLIDTAFEGTLNAYFYNENGESSKLVLPKFNFSAYLNLKLSFYIHMEELNNDNHNLKVFYRNADSLEWKLLRVFDRDYNTWIKKEIPLPDLSDNYQIALEGLGGGGYGICIDSLSVVEDVKYIDAEFTVNKDTICISDSIQFTTSLGDSHIIKWSFGSTAIPSEALGKGPHWVKYTSPGIKNVLIEVNDIYLEVDNEIGVVYKDPAIPTFINSGNTLISSSLTGNQWYLDGSPINGATDDTYIIEEDGEYFVGVTNGFKCSVYSDSKYLVVSDMDEIVEGADGYNYLVYPNPNNGRFLIRQDILKDANDLTYKIVDVNGRIVKEGSIEDIGDYIELQGSNSGIYFIQIFTGTTYFTSKILIKK